jgi:hypothetical protein
MSVRDGARQPHPHFVVMNSSHSKAGNGGPHITIEIRHATGLVATNGVSHRLSLALWFVWISRTAPLVLDQPLTNVSARVGPDIASGSVDDWRKGRVTR